MRTTLLLGLLAIGLCLSAQQDTQKANYTDTISLQQALDRSDDYLRELRNKEWEERNLSGLNYLMEEQRKRREKQKTGAIIRIGIGVLFLAILIIGWRRRSKKTAS